jgi:hypothetical protein
MAYWFVISTSVQTKLTCKGGVASFQAIMHVLSELRNPMFDSPDRQRALRALQMSRILRENNGAKAWLAVKAMIDKAIGRTLHVFVTIKLISTHSRTHYDSKNSVSKLECFRQSDCASSNRTSDRRQCPGIPWARSNA